MLCYQVVFLDANLGWRRYGRGWGDRALAEEAYERVVREGLGRRAGLLVAHEGELEAVCDALRAGDTLAPTWLYFEYRDPKERWAYSLEQNIPDGETRVLAMPVPYVSPTYRQMVAWTHLAARVQRGALVP